MHISINKREALGDNVLDIIEMQEIIEKASIWKVPVYVTLNRLNFPQSCYNVLFAKSFKNLVCVLWHFKTNGWCDSLSS